jgi:hypothetical protein
MEITLDGLVRALRSRAHQMAEEVESGYVRLPQADEETREQARNGGRGMRAEGDDVTGD